MGRSRVGGPVAIASGAARDTTPSRDGAVGRLGSAPRTNRSRAHYEVRCGQVRSCSPAAAPSPSREAVPGVPQARMSGVDAGEKNRDAKTDGGLPLTRRPALRGTPGDRQKFEKIFRRSRGVPRPPSRFRMGSRTPPADRPASLRAPSRAAGANLRGRRFERPGRRAAAPESEPRPHPEEPARGGRAGALDGAWDGARSRQPPSRCLGGGADRGGADGRGFYATPVRSRSW